VRILLVCPAPPRSRLGNRITALRWRRLLMQLGHSVTIVQELDEGTRRVWDVLIALHARRSADAVRVARARFPDRRIVVVLTGTDLYADIHVAPEARRSLELADALVVLHGLGSEALPEEHRSRTHVVLQSAPPIRATRVARRGRSPESFDVAVVGHLRPEKDPLRTAHASRLLPARSRIRVLHAGRALGAPARQAALEEARENPRYTWLGEVSPASARALIASARIFVLSSVLEGGANVISEAIAAGTPVLASRIDCSRALLGDDYPGLFPVGATRELARLLSRAEREPAFLAELTRHCRTRRPLVSPRAERHALERLLRAVSVGR
jgi:putative glycosyltransferase (TIGR04348 family)